MLRISRRGFAALVASVTTGLGTAGRAMSAESGVQVRRQYLDGPFGQMHLRIARPQRSSDALPLICFHSSPNSSRLFERFLSVIGTDRVAIAVDTPGFGDSDPPSEPPEIDDYARAMRTVLKHFSFATVDAMGYHTGSKIAVELARQAPDQVNRLILISAPVYTPDELARQRADFAPMELTSEDDHWVELWREHLRWAMPGWSKEQVAVQFTDALRRPDISWWGHRAAFNYDLGERLPSVSQPTLVLNPDDDLSTQTARAASLLNRGELRHLPGWGHGFLDVHSQEAADLVRGFLDAAQ